MKEHLLDILNLYDEIEAKNEEFDSQIHAEKTSFRKVLNQIIWDDLTVEEKQSKRRRILAILQRGSEENKNFEYRGYEGGIIKYYDLLLELKGKLEMLEEQFLQKRLRALIGIEMREIDKNSRMFNIQLIDLDLFKGLIEQARSTYNFEVLGDILEVRMKLEESKP